MTAREIALDLLNRRMRSRQLADELLDERLAVARLSPADRALATELFYGCLRQKLALEFVVEKLAPKSPRPLVGNLLKLGLYQLLFLDKIPPHAAVHETVALAKRQASPAEAKFVNAVLRNAQQSRVSIDAAPPWTRCSHPRWLWERWVAHFGLEQTRTLCEWNNLPPPLYIRRNTLRAGQPPGEPTRFHPLAYRVREAAGLFDSPAWVAGAFYIQDPSTLVAVDVLDPQPGESVLDVCAAPGGKTTYIAQKMENRGRIIAADSSSARLRLVGENCRRLGAEIVATLACGGTRLNRCLRGDRFDRVLVDAPCSNTGVMRRRPDLRWRLEEREITRLAAVQTQLLQAAAEFVRPGGVLVYSTCSLEPEENERVVERFRQDHPGFARETTRSLFPPRDGVDGVFVARLRNG